MAAAPAAPPSPRDDRRPHRRWEPGGRGAPSRGRLSARVSAGLSRVRVGPEKVQGDVHGIANDPTVVGNWGNMEKLAGPKLDDTTVIEGGRRGAGQHHPDMLDGTASRTDRGPHVLGPTPTRLIRRAANRDTAEPDDLEPTQRKRADLVRRFKPLEKDIDLDHAIRVPSGAIRPR